MSYLQKFVPAAGKVAVVREYLADVASTVVRDDGTAVQIFKTDETATFERKVNPWALVVGVGPEKITESGRVVPQPCEPGDRILVGQIGVSAELRAGDQMETVFVLPFEGVLGRLESTCTVCERVYRTTAPEQCHCGGIVRPLMGVIQ